MLYQKNKLKILSMFLVGGCLFSTSVWWSILPSVALASNSVSISSNPFTDVPRNHWSYEAVESLYKNGIIDGYGDGTFLGEKIITRYEMAQIIAKAMTKKSEASLIDKALIDRLIDEYSKELSSLGVRIENLEKKSDKVKWEGTLRYTYSHEKDSGLGKSLSKNYINLILKPSIEINQNWHLHTRMDGNINLKSDQNYGRFWNDVDDSIRLKHVYAEGNYGKFNMKFGKIPFYEGSNIILDSRDDSYSGASASYSKNRLEINVGAGRWDGDNAGYIRFPSVGFKDKANYQYADVSYQTENKKGNVNVGFHHLNSNDIKKINSNNNNPTDEANIWIFNGKYHFDDNISVKGAYARNISADKNNKSGILEVVYRGANSMEKGSYGAHIAFRYLGYGTTLASSFDTVRENQRGFEIGGSYSPFKNTVAVISYFRGKNITTDKEKDKVENIFGRIYFYF